MLLQNFDRRELDKMFALSLLTKNSPLNNRNYELKDVPRMT